MVVYERAIGGVNVVVWGWLSGRGGDERNERHLKGRWGDCGGKRGRGECSATGSTVKDQALIEVKVGRLVEFMHLKLLSKSSNNIP